MSELIAALAGAIVGGAIGFASSWGLQRLTKASETRAIKEQVTELMRLLEGRMTGMLLHDVWFRGEGWDVADLLAARVFSREGTSAFSGLRIKPNFFVLVAEVQRYIVSIRDVIERLTRLEAEIRRGDHYQSKDMRLAELFRELRTYAKPVRELLRTGRAAIRDDLFVEDPIPDREPATMPLADHRGVQA